MSKRPTAAQARVIRSGRVINVQGNIATQDGERVSMQTLWAMSKNRWLMYLGKDPMKGHWYDVNNEARAALKGDA